MKIQNRVVMFLKNGMTISFKRKSFDYIEGWLIQNGIKALVIHASVS